MKKYILSVAFLFAVLITPIAQVQAAGLTPVQISAIIGLLQAFGADQSVIANVQTALSGGSTTPSGTSPTALITVNGQPSVTNANPLVPRTWAWSGTPGSTYTASGNLSGCDTASQNGPQSNWKPWTDTKATGTASNGSSSIIPGAVKYGCVIVGTYNVTKNGQTTTSTATITYKHANGTVNTAVVNTGSNSDGLTITTGSTLHPIQSDHYWNFNLAYTGGSGTPTWAIVSGVLPATLELDQAKGTINNNNFFNHSPISVNNHIPEGTYTFTVKVTVGSQSATKQLSLEVLPLYFVGRPIIMFDQKGNFAVNEYIQGAGDAGLVGTYHFYYFPSTENDVCTIVSGQLPPGIVFKSSVNGCMISGAPTAVGTYTITWKIENQYGSDTAEYPITVFTPRASITTTASSLPNATIGEPYNYQFPIIQEGNLTAMETSNITFGVRGGMPPGLSIDGSTGLISGTPTVAGLYNPEIYFGVGTEMYLSHVVYPPLLVKPRTQSLSGLNADIVSAMNSLSWTTSNSAQSATSFKATMKQKGWTLGDVATATGYKEIDLVNTLYPVAAGGDLRAPDAVAKYDTIRWLIQGYVQTFDWSNANKQQSAISFKALMDQKGWTRGQVQFSFPFTLGGQDPILTEILKAYDSGTANSSPVISFLSPSGGTIGTTVTINASGLLGTNSIYLNGTLVDTESTSGGLTPTWISFVVPTFLPSCPSWDRLCVSGPALTPGTYTVRVQNTNGASNSLSFVVN